MNLPPSLQCGTDKTEIFQKLFSKSLMEEKVLRNAVQFAQTSDDLDIQIDDSTKHWKVMMVNDCLCLNPDKFDYSVTQQLGQRVFLEGNTEEPLPFEAVPVRGMNALFLKKTHKQKLPPHVMNACSVLECVNDVDCCTTQDFTEMVEDSDGTVDITMIDLPAIFSNCLWWNAPESTALLEHMTSEFTGGATEPRPVKEWTHHSTHDDGDLYANHQVRLSRDSHSGSSSPTRSKRMSKGQSSLVRVQIQEGSRAMAPSPPLSASSGNEEEIERKRTAVDHSHVEEDAKRLKHRDISRRTGAGSLEEFQRAENMHERNGDNTSPKSTRQHSLSFIGNPRRRRDIRWNERFKELRAFKEQHGHVNVPGTYPTDPQLGNWVRRQREACVNEERRAALNEIGFCWHLVTEWEEKFDRLSAYHATYGHCLVPQKYDKDPGLGNWVMNQRLKRNRGELDQTHEDMLNEIGFVWNARSKRTAPASRVVGAKGDD